MLGLTSFAQDVPNCEKGAIREITNGKATVSESAYCYDKNKTRLFSRNCKSRKCVAFDYPEILSVKDFMGPDGSPGFKVCRKVGGRPRIVEFKVAEKWYKLDQCNFQDGSFVNTDFLAHYYFHILREEPLENLGR